MPPGHSLSIGIDAANSQNSNSRCETQGPARSAGKGSTNQNPGALRKMSPAQVSETMALLKRLYPRCGYWKQEDILRRRLDVTDYHCFKQAIEEAWTDSPSAICPPMNKVVWPRYKELFQGKKDRLGKRATDVVCDPEWKNPVDLALYLYPDLMPSQAVMQLWIDQWDKAKRQGGATSKRFYISIRHRSAKWLCETGVTVRGALEMVDRHFPHPDGSDAQRKDRIQMEEGLRKLFKETGDAVVGAKAPVVSHGMLRSDQEVKRGG